MPKKIVEEAISATAGGIASGIETVAEVFTVNAEKDAQRRSDDQQALLAAYQAEFNQRTNRTKIDAFADAFNRLVRPFIVTVIISIFLVAYFSPGHFAQITLALKSVPNGYWTLLGAIISFYFGGRMQLKAQDFAMQKEQVKAVRQLVESREEFRSLATDDDEPDTLAGNTAGKNPEISRQRNSWTLDILDSLEEQTEEERTEALQEKATFLANATKESLAKRRRRGPRRRR